MTSKNETIQEIESRIRTKDVYTTSGAAECLNVFPTTVINWISKGYLKCFRTPGGHRKIPKEELLNFIRNHEFHRNLSVRKKPRVLVVEDDKDARDLVLQVLGETKYEVKAVESGFCAGVAGEFQPDLVVLDVMLPDMDGEQVCRLIRQDSRLKKTKIIAVSAINDEQRIRSLFEAGIGEFVMKPYNVMDFEKKIESMLTETESQGVPFGTKA